MLSEASGPRLGQPDLNLAAAPAENGALSREINQGRVTATHPRPPQEERAKAQWAWTLRWSTCNVRSHESNPKAHSGPGPVPSRLSPRGRVATRQRKSWKIRLLRL